MLIASGLLAIVVLTVATGYSVAQEFACVAVDRGRLQQMAEGGSKAVGRARRVTQKLSFMLSGAQFGITVTALLVGCVAEPLLGAGLGIPGSVVIALAFATFVQMVLGELPSKNLAIARPEQLALSASTLMYLKIAGPLIRLFDAAANRRLRALGIEPVEELPQGATPEDFKQIVEDAGEQGHPDPRLTRLLEHGIGFRELVAEQAMTPRVNVRAVRFDEPASRVVSLLDTGNSRFPVVGDDLDDLRGVVGLAEVLTLAPEQRSATEIEKIASPALVAQAVTAMRAERAQLALVVDDAGSRRTAGIEVNSPSPRERQCDTVGIATVEDLLEELIGDFEDETDTRPVGVR